MKLTLGIDPGIHHTGWGIISEEYSILHLIDNGIITTKPSSPLEERLYFIYENLIKILSSYSNIYESSMEKIFINMNPKSSITLCYARGIALLALKKANIKINEYSANYIKKSLTGNGHASKEQVMYIIKNVLPGVIIKRHDTSDALAAALCHIYINNNINYVNHG